MAFQPCFYLLIALTLVGCRDHRPESCAVTPQEVRTCLAHHKGRSDRDLLLACFPFYVPQTITGLWATGFELNRFFDRQNPTDASGRTDTELETTFKVPNDGRTRVYRVGFIGRRSSCQMGLPSQIIIVDRMKTATLVSISRD